MKFSLEDIPGVGPVRRKVLLNHFDSLTAIREADLAALMSVPGLDRRTANAVFRHFHPEKAGPV